MKTLEILAGSFFLLYAVKVSVFLFYDSKNHEYSHLYPRWYIYFVKLKPGMLTVGNEKLIKTLNLFHYCGGISVLLGLMLVFLEKTN